MRHGFVMPSGDARAAADLAAAAEAAGWDGFFVWEPVWGVDAWVALAAAAMTTERIRLGTLLTPLSRRRPWKVASETATLDNLSGGRVILSTGLGAVDTGFAEFGEETDRRKRAELMDESLDIITGLWAGQPFDYEGTHYAVSPTEFLPPPPPVQQPGIPVWVVGAWPRPKSMARAVRYDGIIPHAMDETGTIGTLEPRHVREIVAFARQARGDRPIDVIVEGVTGEDPVADRARLAEWEAAGATWWIESLWEAQDDPQLVQDRLRRGPARG